MRTSLLGCAFAGVLAIAACASAAPAIAETEADRIVKLLLTPPDIKPAPGFAAKILVAPGELYDPLFMFGHDGSVWLTDDGRELGATGSRIVSVDPTGKVTVIVPHTTTVPMISGGFAPPRFGRFAGQIIMFSQAKTDFAGAFVNHIIQRLDPANGYAPAVVCTLPNAGKFGKGVPGVGVQAAFGPSGSPFGDRFFAATMLNGVIYEMNGAGDCAPFADFSKYGAPAGIAFMPDGKQMLVTTQADNTPGDPVSGGKSGGGMILRVSPEGRIDDQPLAKGFDSPTGLAVAPAGFGAYGGQVFVTDSGSATEVPVPMTQRLPANGRIYRVTPDGEKHLVATGLISPAGLAFFDGQLWVTDVNGDFIGGRRELPDGFIVVLDAR